MDREHRKKKLEIELNAIEREERKELIAEHYPKFKKKYEGKFFKLKNNYSCPEKPSDCWNLYIAVVNIKPGHVYDTGGNGITSQYDGWSFQTDRYGNISIQQERQSYVHSLGKQISRKEFLNAYTRMIEKVNVKVDHLLI